MLSHPLGSLPPLFPPAAATAHPMTRVLLFWHDSKHYSTLSFLYGMTGELQMKAQAKPVLPSSWLGEWKSIQT